MSSKIIAAAFLLTGSLFSAGPAFAQNEGPAKFKCQIVYADIDENADTAAHVEVSKEAQFAIDPEAIKDSPEGDYFLLTDGFLSVRVTIWKVDGNVVTILHGDVEDPAKAKAAGFSGLESFTSFTTLPSAGKSLAFAAVKLPQPTPIDAVRFLVDTVVLSCDTI